jgi:hypothetical protein
MNFGSVKRVRVCVRARVRARARIGLGCNCRTQPSPHHSLMHYLMTLSVAKVMFGALVERYCPGNLKYWEKDVPKCWAIHRKSRAHCYNPDYWYPSTHGCANFKSYWHITPSSQSFILGFIHSFWIYHCVVCTICIVSHTRRYKFSNKT